MKTIQSPRIWDTLTRNARHMGWLMAVVLMLTACSDNDGGGQSGQLPTITFPVASARYRMELGSELEIIPRCEYVDEHR